MPYVWVNAIELDGLANALLQAAGVPARPAATVAEQLLAAELTEHGSHRLRLLVDYCGADPVPNGIREAFVE